MGRKRDYTVENIISKLVKEDGFVETTDIKEYLNLPNKTISYYFNKMYKSLDFYKKSAIIKMYYILKEDKKDICRVTGLPLQVINRIVDSEDGLDVRNKVLNESEKLDNVYLKTIKRNKEFDKDYTLYDIVKFRTLGYSISDLCKYFNVTKETIKEKLYKDPVEVSNIVQSMYNFKNIIPKKNNLGVTKYDFLSHFYIVEKFVLDYFKLSRCEFAFLLHFSQRRYFRISDVEVFIGVYKNLFKGCSYILKEFRSKSDYKYVNIATSRDIAKGTRLYFLSSAGTKIVNLFYDLILNNEVSDEFKKFRANNVNITKDKINNAFIEYMNKIKKNG